MDVFPASVGDASAHAVDFIEPIGVEENDIILAGCDTLGAQKCTSLHLLGFFQSYQRKQSGGEVDECNCFVDFASQLEG